MKSRKTLLNTLLQLLVDEWGYEQVAAGLASAHRSINRAPDAQSTPSKVREKRVKPGAIEQVQGTVLEREQKELLLQLAARYEQKLFLPSVADVREFLIMMGERPVDMKDRKEAF